MSERKTELEILLNISADEATELAGWQPPAAPLAMPAQPLTRERSDSRLRSLLRGVGLRPSA